MNSLKNRTHQRSTRWHRDKKRHCIESAVAAAARRCTIHSAGITGYVWDNAGRLTGITYRRGSAGGGGNSNSGAVIEQITYQYDASGQRISKTTLNESGNQETPFTASYNAANRMTAITCERRSECA